MLKIICGENSVAARDYYQEIIKNYKNKGYYLETITYKEVPEISKNSGDVTTLFNEKRIFLIENLDRYFKPLRKNAKTIDELQKAVKLIYDATDVELIDWEDGKSTYELKLKNIGEIKEFKLDQSIFKLLDSCYPGNRQQFSQILNSLIQTNEDGFIFIMLIRFIRQLILAKSNSLPSNIPPWQRGKLYGQAKLWSEVTLVKFYQGLYRLDISVKTGAYPQTIKDSLDILACYFL